MPQEPFVLDGPGGRRLHGILDLPEGTGRHPAVVLCHGFKGFMEWGFFPHLADLLAARGFVAVRFNFTSAGMQPGDELVTDLEAFRSATFSGDVEELLAVLEAAAGRLAPERVDPQRIGLFGFSRGGGIAILGAGSEAWRDRLRALVTWSAVSTVERFTEEELVRWRREGEVRVVNVRTGQELALGLPILEDAERNRERLDIPAAARRRRAPWLLVHGADDETVPYPEVEVLHRAAAEPKELLRVEGATHTYGSQHPFAGPTPHLIQAMNATQRWLRRHLVG